MTPSRILLVRFSPTGHTRRVMRFLATGFAGSGLLVNELDVTDRYDREEARSFNPDDLVFLWAYRSTQAVCRAPCKTSLSGKGTAQLRFRS